MSGDLDEFDLTELPEVPEGRFVSTQALVAEFFGRSVRQVRRWMKSDGFPEKSREGYDLEAIRDWLKADMGEDMSGVSDPEGYAQARLRKEVASADKLEWEAKIQALRFQLLEEAWHSVDSVQSMFEELAGAVRSALLLIPRKMAADVGARQASRIEELCTRHVDEALDLLASDDFVERLEAERKRLEKGSSVGKGRGRPRKKTRRANR
ncbi:MAG: hypothetical protein AAF196_03020 [Planctomycetota bacterium]